MESPFTFTDHSIDIVGAFFYATAVFWGIHYLWENHLSTAGRIMLIFIIALSGLHIFQVVYQVATDGFPIFRVWDVINYATAILFVMLAHRLAKKESII